MERVRSDRFKILEMVCIYRTKEFLCELYEGVLASFPLVQTTFNLEDR
jgi:hypothetical protein